MISSFLPMANNFERYWKHKKQEISVCPYQVTVPASRQVNWKEVSKTNKQKNPTIYIWEKNVLQQKAMHKNKWVPEPVHATTNMQVRIIDKLKSRSGIPWKVYLKGNTLIDDSCCGVGKWLTNQTCRFYLKPLRCNLFFSFFFFLVFFLRLLSLPYT